MKEFPWRVVLAKNLERNQQLIRKIKSILKASGTEGKGAPESFPWKPLQTAESLESLLQDGHDRPLVLYKHSTSCGFSSMMLRRFQQLWDPSRELADFYLLDLLRYRDLSNSISVQFQVRHQSPQVIIIKDNRVVAHASHSGIDELRPEDLIKTPD
jgi:bacillithiol system protein YtxJ